MIVDGDRNWTISCFNGTYNDSLYDDHFFFRKTDIILGLLLILTGNAWLLCSEYTTEMLDFCYL